MLYGVSLLVVAIVKACIRRSRSCLGGTTAGRVGAARQRTPGIVTDDTIHSKIVLFLVVLDGLPGLLAEDAVHIEVVAAVVQQFLKGLNIIAARSITDLAVFSCHVRVSSFY